MHDALRLFILVARRRPNRGERDVLIVILNPSLYLRHCVMVLFCVTIISSSFATCKYNLWYIQYTLTSFSGYLFWTNLYIAVNACCKNGHNAFHANVLPCYSSFNGDFPFSQSPPAGRPPTTASPGPRFEFDSAVLLEVLQDAIREPTPVVRVPPGRDMRVLPQRGDVC